MNKKYFEESRKDWFNYLDSYDLKVSHVRENPDYFLQVVWFTQQPPEALREFLNKFYGHKLIRNTEIVSFVCALGSNSLVKFFQDLFLAILSEAQMNNVSDLCLRLKKSRKHYLQTEIPSIKSNDLFSEYFDEDGEPSETGAFHQFINATPCLLGDLLDHIIKSIGSNFLDGNETIGNDKKNNLMPAFSQTSENRKSKKHGENKIMPLSEKPASIDLSGKFYQPFLCQRTQNGELKYSEEDHFCIRSVVNKLMSQETSAAHPGMLLGKIQSGKTKAFMAIIGLAFDNGFDISIIFTKGTRALARQTLARVNQEFRVHRNDINVYDIMGVPDNLTSYELNKKLVFIVKKQVDNVNRFISKLKELDDDPNLRPMLRTPLAQRRILIVDDEADYAGIGFSRNSNGEIEPNVTMQQFEDLRQKLPKAAFLQVTATPYALYLQPSELKINGIAFRPVRPAFTELVPVHANYIGSDYYFESSQDEDSLASFLYYPLTNDELVALRGENKNIRFDKNGNITSDAIQGLRSAIYNFLVGTCIRRLQDNKGREFSFLVHTEPTRAAHEWQEKVVRALVRTLENQSKNNNPNFIKFIESSYQEFSHSIKCLGKHLPDLKDVCSSARELLESGAFVITRVNSENDIDALLDEDGQLRLRTPLNVFIGGQILDRGITIANLIGFYYGRQPNVFQQDTVLQHSRMFGFRPKEDLAVTRFYTEPTIYEAMRRMHESDMALREQISAQDGDHDVVFIQTDKNGGVIPCSPNRVMLSNTTTLKPFKRILPVGFQTIQKSKLLPITQELDEKLKSLNANSNDFERPFSIDLGEALNILEKIASTLEMLEGEGYSFDWLEAKSVLSYLAGLNRNNRVLCVVRKDRNIKRILDVGSHSKYADAPDSTKTEGEIRKKYSIDQPMLTLIRQNGQKEKGWNGAPFYWPVISAQENIKTAMFSHAEALTKPKL